MDNPYTKEQFLPLIERKFESSKVDYKQAFPLKDKEKQRDLIKDVVAMANTIDPDNTLAPLSFDPNYAFIIIGCDESGNLHDIAGSELKDASLQEIVNDKVEPKINFLFVPFEHEIEGQPNCFGVVVIFPSERPPHRVTANFLDLRPGQCFIRRGTRNSDASDADLVHMFAHRARFSEVERRLQREEFRITEEEQERLNAIYVEPMPKEGLLQARQDLKTSHFLLIHGPTGIGKRSTALRFALELTSEREALRILRVTRFTPLSELQGAEGSVIIIPDAFGLNHLERFDIERYRRLIEELTKSNHVIMTSSSVVLDEVLNETPLEDWDLIRDTQLHLTPESYSEETLRLILDRHIAWAIKEGRIKPSQGTRLTDFFRSVGDKGIKGTLRLPVSIRRLVRDRLPEIESPKELRSAVNAINDLQQEIRTWLLDKLDNNQRCFLFTLALFDGFERRELFNWYDFIVDRLSKKDKQLSTLLPVVVGSSLSPYVVVTGGIPSFTDPSVHDAVLRVIAEVYREYFLLLVPELKERSLPPKGAKADEEILASQAVREALSFAIGRIGQDGISDLQELIESWASYNGTGSGRVRIAAADALGRTAELLPQRDAVLRLLKEWCDDRTDSGIPKRWTAAATYGRLASTEPDRVAEALARLADDNSPLVRSGVPKPLKTLIEFRPAECQDIYTSLTAKQDSKERDPFFTRRVISRALKSLSYTNLDFVSSLLERWVHLESKYRIWTLARTCFIMTRKYQERSVEILHHLTQTNLSALQAALKDALDPKDSKARVLQN